MRTSTFRLPVPDNGRDAVELHVRRWDPSGEPRAVVQVAHGMAEHSGRYARVAEVLTEAGITVFANDHRGHGETATAPGDLGYFADSGGWQRVVDDLYCLRQHIAAELPEHPHVMFGHSMGSFMVQDYLFSHGSTDAVVLSGTNQGSWALARFAVGVASVERLRLGPRGRSALVKKLSTGDYNRRSEGRTEFDWLSRDTEQVDRYIADPLCGFDFTVQGWIDIFTGLGRIGTEANVRRVPKLPVYLFAGSDDPVGRYGKGVEQVVEAYRRAGLDDVTHRIYEAGRHEMLNEINRDEVERDLVAWLERTVERHRQRAA